MAKAKAGEGMNVADAPVKLVEPVPVGPEVAEAARKAVRYAFKTVVRCPRCSTTDTVARKTDGRIQYRMCRRATCQYGNPSRGLGAWKVIGTPV